LTELLDKKVHKRRIERKVRKKHSERNDQMKETRLVLRPVSKTAQSGKNR
jgi:hypothetical protein